MADMLYASAIMNIETASTVYDGFKPSEGAMNASVLNPIYAVPSMNARRPSVVSRVRAVLGSEPDQLVRPPAHCAVHPHPFCVPDRLTCGWLSGARVLAADAATGPN